MSETAPTGTTGGGRRKLLRLLRIAAVVAGCLCILLLLLPTLLTILPTGRIIASLANKQLPGLVEIDGVHLGWSSPLRIDSIVLRETKDAAAEPVLLVEGISVEKGLWANLFADDRLGQVRIAAIHCDLVRGRDGQLNILKALPASSDGGKAATPDKPFELDLAKIIPPMALPIPALDVEIAAYGVSFRDAGDTAGLLSIRNEGSLTARWRGGKEPLNVGIKGVLAREKAEVPLLVLTSLTNWTRDGMMDLRGADADAKLYFADGDEDPAATLLRAEFRDGGAVAKWSLDFKQFAPVRALAPKGFPLPPLTGEISLSAEMKPTASGTAELAAKLESTPIVAKDFARGGGDVAVPATVTRASATVDRKSLARQGVTFSHSSPFAIFEMKEEPEVNGVYTSSLVGSFDLTALTGIASGTRLSPGVVPLLDAKMTINGDADYTASALEKGSLRASWNPRSLEWADVAAVPLPVEACDRSFDLEPTAFEMAALVKREGDVLDIRADIQGALASLSVTGEYENPERAHFIVAAEGDLGAIAQYAGAQVNRAAMPPLTGGGRLDAEATLAGSTLDLALEAQGSNLRIENPMLAGGSMTDNPTLAMIVTTDLRNDYATTGRMALDSGFLSSAGTIEHGPGTADSLDIQADLQLQPLLALLPPGTVPAEYVALAGSVQTSLAVETKDRSRVELAATMNSGDDFALGVLEQSSVINDLSAETTATVVLASEGLSVELGGLNLWVGDFFATEMMGSYTKAGMEHSFTIDPKATVDLAALSGFLNPILAHLEQPTMTLGGTVTESLKLDGAVAMEQASIRVTRPLRVASETLSEYFEASTGGPTTGFAAAGEGIALHATAEFPSLERGSIEVVDTGAQFLRLETAQALMEFPPLHAEGRVDVSEAGGKVVVPEFTLFSPDVMRLVVTAIADLNKQEYTSVVEAEMEDISRFVIRMPTDLPLDSPPMFSGNAHGVFDASLRLAEAAPGGSLLPFLFAINAKMNWNDVGMNAFDYTIDGINGTFQFKARPDELTIKTDSALAAVSAGGVDVPLARDLKLVGDVFLGKEGRLHLRDLQLKSDALGTSLYIRGFMEDVPGWIARMPAALTPGDAMRWLFTAAFDGYTGFGQELPRLPMMPEGMSMPAGRATAALHLRNTPDRGFEASAESSVDGMTFVYTDLLKVEGLKGSLPMSRTWFPASARVTEQAAKQGRLSADLIEVGHPSWSGAMRDVIVNITTESNRAEASLLCQQFFGGPATAQFRLQREGENPAMSLDFTLTGLDGAAHLPTLKDRPLDRRTVNCFGSMRLVLAENPTVYGLLDRLLVRMEFTELGPEILRETLRGMDASGSNPGIQSTLASLRFSRPVRVVLEIRGGLMNLSIDMTTPTGVIYTIPIFERANASGIIESYVTPEMNEQLEMTRQAALLFLAQRTDEAIALIAPGVPAP